MYFAIGVEPTKLSAFTSGFIRSASTATLSPWTTLNTPFGRPARSSSSAINSDGDGAEGLAQGPVVDAGRNLLGVVALEQLRNAACELDNVDAASDLALRIGEDLAV